MIRLFVLVVSCVHFGNGFSTEVTVPPLIDVQAPQLIAFKIHESLELQCKASGVPQVAYEWMKDGREFDVSGNDNRFTQQPNVGTIVINSPLKKDEGTYQCFAKNGEGTAATQKTILVVAQLDQFPPVEKPTVREGYLGEPLTLTCTPPKSIPPPEIFWIKVTADGNVFNVPLTNRISIDSYGDLHFANLVREDQLEDGSKYQCAVNNKYTRGMNTGRDQVIVVKGDNAARPPPRLMWSTTDARPIAIAGQKFVLKCIFSGMPTPQVDWYRIENGTSVDPEKKGIKTDSFGQELVFERISPSDAGMYECRGWNMESSNSEIKAFDLKVESKPIWLEKPKSVMVGEGDNVTLHCHAYGNPNPSISWFINGKPVEKADPNPRRQVRPTSITYTDLRLTDTEVVQCNASNPQGYIFTNAYVTVQAVPPVWTVPPPPVLNCAEGQKVNISCQTRAAPRAKVSWTKDGNYLTGGRYHIKENGDLMIEDVASTDTGRFSCSAVNRFGNLSDSTNVFVRRATRIVRHPEDLWVNIGTEAKFICTVNTDPESISQLRIVWYKDWKPINHQLSLRMFVNYMDNSLTITDVQVLDTARYTCKAMTNYDVASASAQLRVRAPPLRPKIIDVNCVKKKRDKIAIVKWKSDGTNYAPILGYYVQYNTSHTPDHWTTAVEIVDDIESTTVEVQMAAHATYSFRVIARNRLGNSLPGLASGESCTTEPEPPSSNPINVRVRGTTPTNLVIYWTIMLPLEHHGLGFKYIVEWECVDPKCTSNQYRGQSEVSTYLTDHIVIEHQLTYKKYRVTVQASNEKGTSTGELIPVYGFSGSNAPNDYPRDFRVDEYTVGATRAQFRWTPVANDPRVIHGELKGYVVKSTFELPNQIYKAVKMATFFFDHIEHRNATIIPTDEPTTTTTTAAPPGPERGDVPDLEAETTLATPRVRRSVVTMTEEEIVVIVDDLPPAMEIELSVAVVNEAYMGPLSPSVTIHTKEGLPGPVFALYAKRRLSNRVILVWDPPEEPNGDITGYMVAHREVHGLNLGEWDWDASVADPEVRMSSVSGLKPSQQYRFFVYAVTNVGRGEANYIDAYTISPGKPTAPTFSVVGVDDNSINVTWVPSLVGNPGSVFYVQYKKIGRPEWESSRVETLHDWINVTMLDPGTRYSVRVVARNGNDQEASTHSVTVTTSGFSSRLDLILGHAWFICLFLIVLILSIIPCVVRYWKNNKPLRYPGPYDDKENAALNTDYSEPRFVEEIANRGFEKSASASVDEGPPLYAPVRKGEVSRARSGTQLAEYGDEPDWNRDRSLDYGPPRYAPRQPDPPEVFRPEVGESRLV